VKKEAGDPAWRDGDGDDDDGAESVHSTLLNTKKMRK
jgi:hypothetical protein